MQGEDHPAPMLAVRKKSTSSQCDICFEQYSILGKWPILACPNQHFFCDHCLQGLFALNSTEPAPCPICRALIRKRLLRPHRELLRTFTDQKAVEAATQKQSNPLFAFAFKHELLEVSALFKEGKGDQVRLLQRLEAGGRSIPDISLLLQLPNLNALHLQNNFLTSANSLQQLTALKILNLSGNQLAEIDCLSSLSRLENLAAEFNQITKINLFGFCKLKHFFVFGNPLEGDIVDELQMIEFSRLSTLSFSIKGQQSAFLTRNFLESLSINETLLALNRLILEDLFNQHEKKELEAVARTNNGPVVVEWLQRTGSLSHQQWLQEFFHQRHIYGEAFRFIVDPDSPNLADYKIQGRKVIKSTCNFTSLNSISSIPKEGKQSFKFRVVQPSSNLFVGVSNAFLRQKANIYSEHFIGLTFWGTIYARGECVPLVGRVRYEDHPTICMTVDFDEQTIRWFSDEHLVGQVPLPPQLRFSELYFLFGMRDTDTAIELLDSE